MHTNTARRAVVVAAITALMVPIAPAAHAGDHGGRSKSASPEAWEISEPLAQGLVGPLGLSVAGNGDIYVAESFGNQLRRIRDGRSTVVATVPGIAGIDVSGSGRRSRVSFTSSVFSQTGTTAADLRELTERAGGTVVADIWRFEQRENPDAVNSYGFQDLSAACAAQVAAALPDDPGKGRPYDGHAESHPYAVATLGNGDRVVADAGGNDIVRVDRRGRVSLVAVLPPIPLKVTAQIAAGQKMPACAVGATYNFEPVPTDVEVGRDGRLYVTTLPGGPEDPSLGARGSVFRISPGRGTVRKVADGFLGAVDLAISPRGTIYVAELFGNRISRVSDRRGAAPVKVVDIPGPAALEWADGKLYATQNSLPPEGGRPNGSVVTISRVGGSSEGDGGGSDCGCGKHQKGHR